MRSALAVRDRSTTRRRFDPPTATAAPRSSTTASGPSTARVRPSPRRNWHVLANAGQRVAAFRVYCVLPAARSLLCRVEGHGGRATA
jgi:hypothetical protein